MNHKKLYFISVLIFGLLIAGCGAVSGNQANLDGTSWVLVSIQGSPVVPGTTPTLKFEDSQVSGNSGCNSFGGSYTISGGKISFGELFATLMACADNGVMEQETAYMQALGQVGEFQLEEGRLTLLIGGQPALIFSRSQ